MSDAERTQHYVYIVEIETNTITRAMGPMSGQKADRACRDVLINLLTNLDPDKYFVAEDSTGDVYNEGDKYE